jgi:hypothetical protein
VQEQREERKKKGINKECGLHFRAGLAACRPPAPRPAAVGDLSCAAAAVAAEVFWRASAAMEADWACNAAAALDAGEGRRLPAPEEADARDRVEPAAAAGDAEGDCGVQAT